MTAIQNDFSDYKVDDAEKRMKDGETCYQISLEKFLSDEEKVFSDIGELQNDIIIGILCGETNNKVKHR